MRDGALVVCASLGDVSVVIDARHVERIGEASELARTDASMFDLSAIFGVRCASTDRRALALNAGRRTGWALVDNHVHVRRLEISAFGAAPTWLSPAWRSLSVRRVVRFDETFGFEIDVAALLGQGS